jgi:SAM-dependent methyltransferase
LLLGNGLNGTAYDLNPEACAKNAALNEKFIKQGRYQIYNQDFIEVGNNTVDLIISSMVIEHLSENDLDKLMSKALDRLSPKGRLIFLVPASKKHWGIEDEIAGHFLRYEINDVNVLANKFNLNIDHLVGLTYPLSNWLIRISNSLIKNKEEKVLQLSQREKTIYTGNREVKFKTTFPFIFKIFLNSTILYPFYVLQSLNLKNKNALVLYFEFSKIQITN